MALSGSSKDQENCSDLAEDSRKPSNSPQALLCSTGSGPGVVQAEKAPLSPEILASGAGGESWEPVLTPSTSAGLHLPAASLALLPSEAWWRATSPAFPRRSLRHPLRRGIPPSSPPSSRRPCMLVSPGRIDGKTLGRHPHCTGTAQVDRA